MRPRRFAVALVALVLLTGLASPAAAAAGQSFKGGSLRQQAQVRAALDASSFDWALLPRPVTVHIGSVGVSYSTPGHVWLDGRLLNAGRFAWATVLDEFAHQVDFQLLDSSSRALLQERLGAQAWCYEVAGLAHGAYGCERFASTFAWAYWPSIDNAYRPQSRADESAAMPPAAFRTLLARLLAPRAAG